ncbi:MAG: rpsN [Gammaproteobacteria bacterium]|jgi:small subunit ribosomal protein S14|nr:rpsN [Gammaproteobacteria bacterium]
MAKTSSVEREKKRSKLALRHRAKILDIKEKLRRLYIEAADPNANFDTVYEQVEALQEKLQRMPRNAHVTRGRRRCEITGRSRGVYRKFGMCKSKVREFAMLGWIPGLRKASW